MAKKQDSSEVPKQATDDPVAEAADKTAAADATKTTELELVIEVSMGTQEPEAQLRARLEAQTAEIRSLQSRLEAQGLELNSHREMATRNSARIHRLSTDLGEEYVLRVRYRAVLTVLLGMMLDGDLTWAEVYAGFTSIVTGGREFKGQAAEMADLLREHMPTAMEQVGDRVARRTKIELEDQQLRDEHLQQLEKALGDKSPSSVLVLDFLSRILGGGGFVVQAGGHVHGPECFGSVSPHADGPATDGDGFGSGDVPRA